ncbi:hypothetical protein [Stenotrophomonas sp.]|uniref:hypothetical protein n=1 Tax=Stenotrophomonas sp. TaxID=69392 RepID=UPI002D5087B2|nr:hypothetical protein [Stenotrophomonas sp.]HYQ22394.1 hypothetical protein [Stenotrophomonas sp.]
MEEFITNAALLAGHLTQQCEKAAAAQDASSAQLQRAAAEVGQGVASGRAELAQSARAAVREALSQEIPAAVEAISDTGDRLAALAEQLSRQQVAMASRLRMLTWKALIALALGGAAIVGGTAFFARSNVQRAQQAKVEAQVLEALEQVSITSCDGRPCIKLEDGLQRWSRNDEYILVDTRNTAAARKK